ncbi:biotin transporter BioY [Candidatus Liberibacter brunswickensis]|uniref:biotin transporter BioY n=1 Tax=Candidatus Liberibacter brunswickensis TaxID=1968796 RepID=UPI002FE1DF78
MYNLLEYIVNPVFNIIYNKNKLISYKITAIIFAHVLLTLSSYVAIPIIPVPVTMQTFSVTLIGAIYGWRLGGITIISWLIEGIIGFPVFALGNSGFYYFIGSTSGYLVSFPIAAMLVGWLVELGWSKRLFTSFVCMLIGNFVIIVFGVAYLSTFVGYKHALVVGAVPFILGSIIKSALAAVTLKLIKA